MVEQDSFTAAVTILFHLLDSIHRAVLYCHVSVVTVTDWMCESCPLCHVMYFNF